MDITEFDRTFYIIAVEYLTEKMAIADDFVKYNGMTSMPLEEITDLMISGIKEWIHSEYGEMWLHDLGYHKVTYSGSVVSISGTDLCPVCSGNFFMNQSMACERCGRVVCNPCNSIVDNHYGILWCEQCLTEEGLTNVLLSNG